MTNKASKLIQDLSSVPGIVGGLGLSIAEAQKAFNLDYMDNIERLLGLTKALLDPKVEKAQGAPTPEEKAALKKSSEENAAVLESILKQLAPSRYQFTETTLAVKLDLAQTMDLGASGGFSVGMGAVAVNAAMTVGYGYDYRAAAEVRTVIHAIPSDQTTMNTLLGRAEKLSDKALELPAGATVDKEIVNKAHSLTEKILDKDIKKPEEKKG